TTRAGGCRRSRGCCTSWSLDDSFPLSPMQVRVLDRGLRVQSQRGSIELRIYKHAEVHEAVPSIFLHQGSDFTGSTAIGDFDSEHVCSFRQHRLIPIYKFGWKITEVPVPLRRSLNQINSVLPMQKDQIGIWNSRAVKGRYRGVDLRASIHNADQQA